MSISEHVARMKEGSDVWNQWRREHPDIRPSLRDCDFEREIHEYEGMYDFPLFDRFDLSRVDLHGIAARNSNFVDCRFDGAAINFADLCFSQFNNCTFIGVSMRVTRIGSASFIGCKFEEADLAYCSAEETSFRGSRFLHSSLNHVSLVKADFTDAVIDLTSVYGVSAWDLKLTCCEQRDLVITEDDNMITVDNLAVAQFIHLLIHNANIRHVIDTITSKVVLILGRFTPERKAILRSIRNVLKKKDYVPVLFDFQGPASRDLTESISVLAHLSKFVIADLTEPRSIPHELSVIAPALPSVPIQPIIEAGDTPFGMFEHFNAYPWVLPIKEYERRNLKRLANSIIEDCERALPRPV
jgi:uncharacterized protein YjbI with pentapeptide repeats